MIKFDVKPRASSRNATLIVGATTRGDQALIGNLSEVGPATKVFLSLDYEHVIGIFGKRGSGKSHLLGSLIEAIAWQKTDSSFAQISELRGGILFDVLNIFQWMGNAHDVPVAVSLFHVPGFQSPASTSTSMLLRPLDLNAEDWCTLLGIDGLREPMGQLLHEAVSITKARKLPKLDDLLRAIDTMSRRFSAETIRAVTQRITTYSSLGLFDENGISLRALCAAKSVSIILLAGVPEDIRSLYIFLILRRVYEERVRSSQLEKATKLGQDSSSASDLIMTSVPKMWLFIDEAQNIIPSRNATYAVDMLVRFVREGRNYGLSLCFTAQQPSSIDTKILSQMDTLVSFVVTVPSDLAAITNNLKNSSPRDISQLGKSLSFSEAIRSLATGQCMVSNLDNDRTLFIQARERLTPHGGSEG